MKHYDLIVAGGGFAGVGAAIAAARQGLSVLLTEETNALGGAANRCLVNPFMPFYTPLHPAEREERKLLSRGIFEEICGRLADMTASINGENSPGSRQPLRTFSEEYLKILLNRMCLEAGVTLLFHTSVIGAVCKDGHVSSLTAANADGVSEITADLYIDCTGDADIAVRSGFPFHLGREEDHLCQPMTLCFRVGDVDIARFNAGRAKMQELYKQRQADGRIKNVRENVLVFPTVSPTVLHFNTTRVIKLDPTNAEDITRAEIEAREQVFEMFMFLRECADGCENAQLLSTAMQTGVRESRMIDGEYTLTQDDLLAFTKFGDGIAACNYDIDIHNPAGSGTSHFYFPAHEYYTIPYRCLIPRGSHNLLVAGRCISSTHEAQASYRIIPVVCTLGEAAGVAASVAHRLGCGVNDAPSEEIRSLLRASGAVVD